MSRDASTEKMATTTHETMPRVWDLSAKNSDAAMKAKVMENKAATPKKAQKLSTAVNFATAGLGGILGWIVVHPFNTVAVRMNLASMSSGGAPTPGVVRFGSDLVKSDGLAGLYAGLGAGITRQIFYATSRFGLFEVLRDVIAQYRETDVVSRLFAGCVSGGIAALISCPAEVSLVRMSNDSALPLEQRRNYSSVMNAATRILSEEGVSAFYRGCGPFVNRAMLVGACQVGTFDQFKASYKSLGVTGAYPNVFCAAMSSGLLYSVVTNPLETAKNRMAFQKPDASGQLPYRSTIQTVTKIAAEEGPTALWKGFPPYYLRCGGHTVSMFIFVEMLRRAYSSTMH